MSWATSSRCRSWSMPSRSTRSPSSYTARAPRAAGEPWWRGSRSSSPRTCSRSRSRLPSAGASSRARPSGRSERTCSPNATAATSRASASCSRSKNAARRRCASSARSRSRRRPSSPPSRWRRIEGRRHRPRRSRARSSAVAVDKPVHEAACARRDLVATARPEHSALHCGNSGGVDAWRGRAGALPARTARGRRRGRALVRRPRRALGRRGHSGRRQLLDLSGRQRAG